MYAINQTATRVSLPLKWGKVMKHSSAYALKAYAKDLPETQHQDIPSSQSLLPKPALTNPEQHF